MKHKLEYYIIKAFFFLAKLMPFSVAMRFGDIFGRFLYYLFPYRKDVVNLNLKTAFPQKTASEREQIIRKMYRHIAMMIFEYLTVWRMSAKKLKSIITFYDMEVLEKAYLKEKGVIIVSGHFGSFELMGAGMAAQGFQFDAVVKAMSNKYVEDFLDFIRSHNGYGVIKKGKGLDDIIAAMKINRGVGLVADQDAGANGVFVSFFGQQSSTPAGPAVLAHRTGAPMVAIFAMRKGIGRYDVKAHEVSLEGLPENEDEKLREITQRYTTLLEEYVIEYPDHYMWTHKRWKTLGLYNNI